MTPRKRTEDLAVEVAGDEVLVYDLRTDAAHRLDPDAGAVWDACDGRQAADEIAEATGVPVLAVEATLERLAALDLVAGPAGHTRRSALRRMGVVAALPVIASIAAPAPAQAASLLPAGSPCSSGAQCQSQVCNNGVCS